MNTFFDAIMPLLLDKEFNYISSIWEKEEIYRFYIKHRRLYCSFLEILDLWIKAPYCIDCILDEPLESHRAPEIMPNSWENDIQWEVDEDTFEKTQDLLKADQDFCFSCLKCAKDLRPWEGDELYVFTYHLEEHYGIPLEDPNRIYPFKKLTDQIKKLHDHKCFRCNSDSKPLQIDHIMPKSEGGDAAFRNLQPLCEDCNQLKGNKIPETIEVFSTIFFCWALISRFE